MSVSIPSNAVMVRGNDWEGLYLNGRLVAQGHRVDVENVLRACGVAVHPTVEPDQDWLENEGMLPDTLSEVKRRAR
ncbi:hypothetical protein [Methylobacterium oryzisoli]|uniref:hypothetical protein n=1 Tax=Methylobacterium oryzisoli TaxID=3385502 RepID=UPI003891FE19